MNGQNKNTLKGELIKKKTWNTNVMDGQIKHTLKGGDEYKKNKSSTPSKGR